MNESISCLILTLGLMIYLLIGFRLSMRSLFRMFLFVQLLGDLLFSSYWDNANTYAFLRYISDSDRLTGLLILGGCVLASDAVMFILQRLTKPRPEIDETVDSALPLAKPGEHLWLYFAVGVGLKFVGLFLMGALGGEKSLALLRPEDSVGLAFFGFISDFLIPFGLAIRHYNKPLNRFPFLDLLLILGLGFLSSSKAGAVIYLFVYLTSYTLIQGSRTLWKSLFDARLLLIALLIVVSVGIKTQDRSNVSDYNLTIEGLVEKAFNGTSARLSGGIYRTYLATAREVVSGRRAVMDGEYHNQTLYMWIPRALWPEKPRVASEQLYYYLDVTEESYGTAFAITAYGALLVDYGIYGALLGSALLGVVFYLEWLLLPTKTMTRAPTRLSIVRLGVSAIWLSTALKMSEGGIPPAFTYFLITALVFLALSALNRFLYFPLRKSTSETPVGASTGN